MLSPEFSLMDADPIAALLAWVLTYSLHSTALLGGAWILLRFYKGFSDGARDTIWKLALVGGVVTATAQVGFGLRAFGASLLEWTPETTVVTPREEPTPLTPFELKFERPDSFASRDSRVVQSLARPREQVDFSTSAIAFPVPVVPTTAAQARAWSRRPIGNENASTSSPKPKFKEPIRTASQKGELGVRTEPTPIVSTQTFEARTDLEPVREAASVSLSEPKQPIDAPAASSRRPLARSTELPAVPEVENASPELVLPTSIEAPLFAQSVSTASPNSLPASPWYLLPWVVSVCAGVLAIALALVRLRRALVRRTPLQEGTVAELFRKLLRRSGSSRKVRLSTSAQIAAPITFGLWRAEICLPDRALVELDIEPQEAMLAHELAHAIRRDPLWQLITKSMVAIFFFQPLNRLARKRILDLAEYLSDDWAVAQTGRELPLASCLTEVARWLVAGKKPLLAPGMADGSRLSTRVYRLLDQERRRSVRSSSRIQRVALATTGLIAFSGFAPGITAAPLDDKESETLERLRSGVATREADAPPKLLSLEALDDAEPIEPAAPSTTELVRRMIQRSLSTLDTQIDELQVELASLRGAISKLQAEHELEESLWLVEGQLDQLRQQRELLADELPKLTRLLQGETHPSDFSDSNHNPRKMNR